MIPQIGTAYFDAGLPNIIGSFAESDTHIFAYGSGAFAMIPNDLASEEKGGDRGSVKRWGFNFNASWSNPIYGRSMTVQPASTIVNFFVRAK